MQLLIIFLNKRYNFVRCWKVAGMQYLHRLLGPIVSRIFEEKKYVELDPNKVELKEAG